MNNQTEETKKFLEELLQVEQEGQEKSVSEYQALLVKLENAKNEQLRLETELDDEIEALTMDFWQLNASQEPLIDEIESEIAQVRKRIESWALMEYESTGKKTHPTGVQVAEKKKFIYEPDEVVVTLEGLGNEYQRFINKSLDKVNFERLLKTGLLDKEIQYTVDVSLQVRIPTGKKENK